MLAGLAHRRRPLESTEDQTLKTDDFSKPSALALAGVMVALTACGGGAGEVRFHNQPIVWQVADTADVPETPKNRPFARLRYFLDAYALRKLTWVMEVPVTEPAQDVNALGEVPDSTWFEHRIARPGVPDGETLSAADVARGPSDDGGPDRSAPWRVTGTKIGGTAAGLMFKDARGVRYLLKFDEVGVPEMETGADVVVQRLLWAAGYHVPDDGIVSLRREDLTLAEGARVEDVFGNKRPMTEADIDLQLSLVQQKPDGSYRGLYSRFLPGRPIGGYAQEGIRADDPNDTIPHENRRSIRGQYVFFSWLKHTDIKEDNWLDMWVEDPKAPGQHHVKHFLLDFGKGLGTLGRIAQSPSDGYTHVTIDYASVGWSLITFGLWKRPFDGLEIPDVPAVGHFDVHQYEPGGYAARTPFIPFKLRTEFDDFWAARIVMRFTPEHLRAAVEQGRYSTPETTEYLVKTLIGRQQKMGRWAFGRVNPLAEFTAGGEAKPTVCFEDLWLKYGYAKQPGATRWQAVAYGDDGEETGWSGETKAEGHKGCLSGITPGGSDGSYTVVAIETVRGEDTAGEPVRVHLAQRKGRWHVIGVRRSP